MTFDTNSSDDLAAKNSSLSHNQSVFYLTTTSNLNKEIFRNWNQYLKKEHCKKISNEVLKSEKVVGKKFT